MDSDALLISRIDDYARRASDGYYAVSSGFLDSHEQAVTKNQRNAGIRTIFYGGYEGAERRLAVFVPTDYGMSDDEITQDMLQVLHISIPKGSKQLTHRDYLGSVLGLGIERRLIGDILVRDDGADMIILPEIADFLLSEYIQVGRTDIRTELRDINALVVPEQHTTIVRDTVSSARLDNIVASAFKLSRTKAVEAIKAGIVSVNHIEVTKPDTHVEEGDALVLRGKGKAIVTEIGGESKKGRIWITIEKLM